MLIIADCLYLTLVACTTLQVGRRLVYKVLPPSSAQKQYVPLQSVCFSPLLWVFPWTTRKCDGGLWKPFHNSTTNKILSDILLTYPYHFTCITYTRCRIPFIQVELLCSYSAAHFLLCDANSQRTYLWHIDRYSSQREAERIVWSLLDSNIFSSGYYWVWYMLAPLAPPFHQLMRQSVCQYFSVYWADREFEFSRWVSA